MTISFQAAVNAYNNAAKYDTSVDSGQGKMNVASGQESQFANIAKMALGSTTQALRGAEDVVARNLVKQADMTDVVTAMTNAEVMLKAVVATRDRMVAALQEITKMPI